MRHDDDDIDTERGRRVEISISRVVSPRDGARFHLLFFSGGRPLSFIFGAVFVQLSPGRAPADDDSAADR